MRLIIKEYISQLKEKDELDLLLLELLVQNGYVADNIPRTGNRQYGVDIQLHNEEEILLLVIKQGNIDRTTWDSCPNAVRQSLDEIKDAYMDLLTEQEKKKKIKVVVATNGVKEESIRANWKGYVDHNKDWNGKKVEIEFWGIDDIVKLIQLNYLNEHIFEQPLQSALRKALYFVEETDYKKEYYEKIIQTLLAKITTENNKGINKSLTCLHLSCEMICQYANNSGNSKIAINVSEYLLIQYWKFLFKKNYFGKKKWVEWLLKFCMDYEKWNDVYYQKIHEVCIDPMLFPNYNVVENRIILYEIMGYLTAYATYLFVYKREKALLVLNDVISLINNYPNMVYAPFDSNIGIKLSLYRLLAKYNRIDDIKILLEDQSRILVNYYRGQHKYPAPSDTFEEAINIESRNLVEEYKYSGFWGYTLLCIVSLDFESLYNEIKEFLKDDLEQVAKCIWFLRKNEEEIYYERCAMNLAGEGVELPVEMEYSDFKRKAEFILSHYKNEQMSFDEFNFEPLEIIICRYYGYIPRINANFLFPQSQ